MSAPTDLFKLLGDPTRFKILRFLADPLQCCGDPNEAVCACDLETFLGVSQPTVSHHMKQLVDAGLVNAERRGRWVYYELAPAGLRELAGVLEDLAAAALPRREPLPA